MTKADKKLWDMCNEIIDKYITFKGTPTADRILTVCTELKKRLENNAPN